MGKLGLLATLVLLIGTSAQASEETIKGVYLQSEELCARAKTESLQSLIESGALMLSSRGIESIEYNCEFVTMVRAKRAPAWAVTALCQEPGHLFPDTLSILELSPTQLDVVSVRTVDTESGQTNNAGTYYLCDGVALP